MDEQLAAIYGTGQSYDESDLEKTAAAELLVKLAEEQGADLNDFSDAEIAGMIDELYQGGGIMHTAADAEYQEKVAEADYLGRIMAHSMVQELNNIEKEAGNKFTTTEKLVNRLKGSAVGKFVAGRPEAYREAGKAAKQAITGKDAWGVHVPNMRGFKTMKALKAVAPELAAAGGIGAAGTGAALAYRAGKKKKEASALDTLAEQRAYELAVEAGYIDDGFSKQASLDYEVERRALEICEENGIPVQWS
jgi:hypothetical protein